MPAMKFSERMGELVRRLLSCCDRDEAKRPMLHISAPTNFRREDVSIPGLSEMQQSFIREIAKEDAKQMYEDLQPLRSSPSATFTDRPNLPPYQEFASPRATPSPRSPALSLGSGARRSSRESRLDRVRAHSRKISDALTKPMGFNISERDDGTHETKALIEYDGYMSPSPEKPRSELSSVAGSEEEKMTGSKF